MRIATRGSALALAQAQWVAERLAVPAELVPLVTTGDRHRAVDDKREWVIELEDALLRGDADLAVHSAKDVPVALADGLELIAAPEREDPRDVLCGAASLDDVAPGARIGTSSLRRASQLRAVRPDVEVVELRGNVDTRLRKLAGGEADAIVLAAAGLIRLGRGDEAGCALDLVPAAGQGTLVIEARAGDQAARDAVAPLRHEPTERALRAERALVAALEADCRTPVGAHAEPVPAVLTGLSPQHEGDCPPNVKGTVPGLRMRAFVGAEDGSAWVADALDGEEPEALGRAVAERLLAAGAAEVLGR